MINEQAHVEVTVNDPQAKKEIVELTDCADKHLLAILVLLVLYEYHR